MTTTWWKKRAGTALLALLASGQLACGGGSSRAHAAYPPAPSEGAPVRAAFAPEAKKLAAEESSYSDGEVGDTVATPPPPPPADAPRQEAPGGASGETSAQPARDPAMLVFTARVTMAVYQVDQSAAAVEKIARDVRGYLSLKRDREIVIRVPRDSFQGALTAIDKLGDVLHRDIDAEDVTDAFVDTELRIKNARAMQTRLKQLLERAPVKEALDIEKELRRVTEEIELLEGKLKVLKDRIAYSTITVVFEPRGASLHATRVNLPFTWLHSLGLPTLLRLTESR